MEQPRSGDVPLESGHRGRRYPIVAHRNQAQRVDASVIRLSCEPDTLRIGKARFPSELFPKGFDLLQQVIN